MELSWRKQEAYETILQCAKREVSEEVGIKVNDLNEIHFFGR